MSHVFFQTGHSPQRAHRLAGHVRFELGNVDANYPFERSHRFAGIQPNSGFGDYSRFSFNAFDPESGKFLSKVRDPKGQAILIDGLWTIRFGSNNDNGGAANTLYFTAGPNDETDGLFGSLNPN